MTGIDTALLCGLPMRWAQRAAGAIELRANKDDDSRHPIRVVRPMAAPSEPEVAVWL
jgi:hypothetical protein